jgi:hypothetical protein
VDDQPNRDNPTPQPSARAMEPIPVRTRLKTTRNIARGVFARAPHVPVLVRVYTNLAHAQADGFKLAASPEMATVVRNVSAGSQVRS